MATLFNVDNQSFLDFIKDHTRKLSKINSYKFYAMTCYFKQDATKELAASIQAILDNRLSEFHILIDQDEYCKEILDINFIDELENITGLPSKNISITPISTTKLFHAKAYALINCDNKIEQQYQGFGIVTSANLTNGGIHNNIEIGHVFDDNDSLKDLYNLFIDLKDNYSLSEKNLAELLEKAKEFPTACNLISLGSFYHQWKQKHQIDLTFRLRFSEEVKKIKKNNRNNVDFKLQELGFNSDQDTFSKNPINIGQFFEIFPKTIPDVLGICSIDTLLGKWIPNKISDLIEKELKENTDIYINILQKYLEKNMDNYLKELEKNVQELKNDKIIDLTDEDNLNAIKRWEKRIIQISKDKNLLRLLLWEYERIPISLYSIQEPDLILTIYDRLKEFYNPNKNRQGVGKILSENNHQRINDYFFVDLFNEVQKKIRDNSLGDLYKEKNDGKYFCAIVKPENQIVTGIFLRLDALKAPELIFYKTEANKEQEIKETLLLDNLVTFKIIENEDKEILHKFDFM